MAILNHTDLIGMEMVVECLYSFVRIYCQNLWNLKWEFFVELNLREKNGSYVCSHNPKYSRISYHLSNIGKDLNVLTSKYGNIILTGGFNAEPIVTPISDFCEIYNLKNKIKDKTFQKSKQTELYWSDNYKQT